MTPSVDDDSMTPFANLSNHPVEQWSAEQVDSARALGLGAPMDWSRPDGSRYWRAVPPEDDTPAIREVCAEIADELVAAGIRDAHVAGEPTFSHHLLVQLEAHGIRCWVATTRRDAVEETLADGSVVKRSHFRFVRWRRVV